MEEPGNDTKLVEVYGFAGWILSALCYLCFLVWAFLPEEELHKLGVTYYPAKYWAIGVPAYVTMVIALTLVSYIALTWLKTPTWTEEASWTDPHACPLPSSQEASFCSSTGTPEISDLPLTVVNQLMFEEDSDEEDRTLYDRGSEQG
eukprot:gb/GECG01013191.1/.p1 GENE.gb/GECG01013191.1/~~gb/GECG01013191.1/.p1  ORF type:complete len:147 (+),score=14.58 gb/GECG01013191.1/:1-441(+)